MPVRQDGMPARLGELIIRNVTATLVLLVLGTLLGAVAVVWPIMMSVHGRDPTMICVDGGQREIHMSQSFI